MIGALETSLCVAEQLAYDAISRLLENCARAAGHALRNPRRSRPGSTVFPEDKIPASISRVAWMTIRSVQCHDHEMERLAPTGVTQPVVHYGSARGA